MSSASAVIPVVLVAVVIAACGGGEQDDDAVAVEGARPVEVAATEYAFEPAALAVRSGTGSGSAPVEIALANEGSLAHNLVVFDGDRRMEGTKVIVGGERATLEASLAPGEYRFVCTVGDHAQRGMVGTLRVE